MRHVFMLFLAAVILFSGEQRLFAQGDPQPPVLSMDEDLLQGQTKEISKTLRCAVCQSESVWESNATLAIQMRDIVRERLIAGQSPDEIRAYFVSRYGDYIVFKPRFGGINLLLWGGPFILLVLGGIGLFFSLRKWTSKIGVAETKALAPIDEKQRQRIEDELR